MYPMDLYEGLGYLEDDSLGAPMQLVRSVPAGARRIISRRAASPAVRRRAQARAVAAELSSPAPGIPGVDAAMLPLGFTTIQFTNASATTLTVTSTPQKPIKGRRLVVDLARTAGATQLVTISRFLIGSTNVLPSGQPISVTPFAAGAFHTVLDLVPAGPGITITIDYTVSAAPGAGETIDVATTLIGPSLMG